MTDKRETKRISLKRYQSELHYQTEYVMVGPEQGTAW